MTWLSKKVAAERREEPLSSEGVVSIGGSAPAVVTDGELRDAALVAPGGYHWQPRTAESVLVLRGGRDCVAGVLCAGNEDLEPGEVRITSGGASICLRRDGSLELNGTVYVNGRELMV